MNGRSRIIGGWQSSDVFAQWRRDRDRHHAVSLGFQTNDISRQIDIVPSQSRYVRKSLAGIESENDHAAPFVVADSSKSLNLIERKGALASLAFLFLDRADVFGGIIADQIIGYGGFKDRFDPRHQVIGGRRAYLVGQVIAIRDDVGPGDFEQATIGFFAR